jgi:hypothetical protein
MRTSRVVEVGFGELPLERCGDLLVVVLEFQQSGFQFVESVEVIGRECLSLYNREVDLDLIEPRGVDGRVDQPQAFVGCGGGLRAHR